MVNISLPDVLEDDEFFHLPPCSCCGMSTHGISGWIQDEAVTIGRYFVYWTEGRPSHGFEVDLIIGPPDSPGQCNAVSVHFHAADGITFIDASTRPFARRQALYCHIPVFYMLPDDVVINAAKLTEFILRHDSRVRGIGGSNS